MAEFIEFYNHRRYHEGVGNVTPADVYHGRRKEILKRRKEQQQETLDRPFQYNLGQAPNPTRGELRTELYSLEKGQISLKCPEDAQSNHPYQISVVIDVPGRFTASVISFHWI
jgi:hypothetical protein